MYSSVFSKLLFFFEAVSKKCRQEFNVGRGYDIASDNDRSNFLVQPFLLIQVAFLNQII